MLCAEAEFAHEFTRVTGGYPTGAKSLVNHEQPLGALVCVNLDMQATATNRHQKTEDCEDGAMFDLFIFHRTRAEDNLDEAPEDTQGVTTILWTNGTKIVVDVAKQK